MNEKETFEDIIASKFSEAEFPFDEGNWDNAEDMISSYRTKQKRRRIGFVFFSGIALGVIIMLPFVNRLNNKTDNVIAEVTKTSNENLSPPVLNTETQFGNKTTQTKNNNQRVDINNIITNVSVSKKEKRSKLKEKQIIKAIQSPLETNSNQSGNSAAPDQQDLLVLTKLESPFTFAEDSIPVIQLLNDPEKVVNPIAMRTWNFSAAAGGNYVNSFSFNPIQGIEISKAIRPYFEIGAGAYYTYLSIHSGGVKTITTHTEYDFGYQSDITEIKTNTLHYVVIPVYAKCNVDAKNSFIVGANMFTLFTVSNSVTSYKESYGQKQGTVSKKTTGYSNGINTYDIGLLVGYKRHLFWNIGAAVYFNYGFMDIKKNEYYNENKFERNISGQFMLTYKL